MWWGYRRSRRSKNNHRSSPPPRSGVTGGHQVTGMGPGSRGASPGMRVSMSDNSRRTADNRPTRASISATFPVPLALASTGSWSTAWSRARLVHGPAGPRPCWSTVHCPPGPGPAWSTALLVHGGPGPRCPGPRSLVHGRWSTVRLVHGSAGPPRSRIHGGPLVRIRAVAGWSHGASDLAPRSRSSVVQGPQRVKWSWGHAAVGPGPPRPGPWPPGGQVWPCVSHPREPRVLTCGGACAGVERGA